jgi:hypothetical protein
MKEKNLNMACKCVKRSLTALPDIPCTVNYPVLLSGSTYTVVRSKNLFFPQRDSPIIFLQFFVFLPSSFSSPLFVYNSLCSFLVMAIFTCQESVFLIGGIHPYYSAGGCGETCHVHNIQSEPTGGIDPLK